MGCVGRIRAFQQLSFIIVSVFPWGPGPGCPRTLSKLDKLNLQWLDKQIDTACWHWHRRSRLMSQACCCCWRVFLLLSKHLFYHDIEFSLTWILLRRLLVFHFLFCFLLVFCVWYFDMSAVHSLSGLRWPRPDGRPAHASQRCLLLLGDRDHRSDHLQVIRWFDWKNRSPDLPNEEGGATNLPLDFVALLLPVVQWGLARSLAKLESNCCCCYCC